MVLGAGRCFLYAFILSLSTQVRERPVGGRELLRPGGSGTLHIFWIALDAYPRTPLSLELSEAHVYEPEIRARLEIAAHLTSTLTLAG